ncbi:MAG: NAD(P)-dependent oxidoreductase [Desulfobacteraceae bacterium]|nr:MAG: NAD(P)-dependent oxidoreductase [Desulfobacteraceae bacterium]
MSFCTAVVGAGRMGSLIAEQLPAGTEKIIIDSDLEKASRLAEKVKGKASDNLESAAEADLTAVVLPAPAVKETVFRLAGIVRKGAMILNMATAAHIDPDSFGKDESVAIIDAKIIGHAGSMRRGEPGIVVVGCRDENRFSRIREQFPGFFKVVRGEPDIVEKINRIGSSHGIRAAVTARCELQKLNIPDEWIDVAIRTVCAGTIKSFVEKDLGHFALELVKIVEQEMS